VARRKAPVEHHSGDDVNWQILFEIGRIPRQWALKYPARKKFWPVLAIARYLLQKIHQIPPFKSC